VNELPPEDAYSFFQQLHFVVGYRGMKSGVEFLLLKENPEIPYSHIQFHYHSG
jgi:hypothetical protein